MNKNIDSNKNDSNKNKINVNLYNFYQEKDFYKKTSFLIKTYKNLEKENSTLIPFKEQQSVYSQNEKGKYLTNGYYIYIIKGIIYIKSYYRNKLNIVADYKLNTYSLYYSYNISLFDNKIIYLIDKTILILKYDLNKRKILLNEKIELNNIINCLEIKKDHYLIVRNTEHILWVNKKQKIRINNNYNKVFPANDEFYLAYNSSNNVLTFNDVNTLQEIKKLKNIIDPIEVSILNNEFITFINFNDMYLIDLKSKELVQIVNFIPSGSYGFMSYSIKEIFIVDKNIYLYCNNELVKKYKYISEDKYFEESEINISQLYTEKEFGYFLAYEDF